MINRFQRAAAEVYAEGDFSDVETLAAAKRCGDTLFTFIMTELADDGEPMTADEAARRLQVARREMQAVSIFMDQMED